MRKLVSFDWAIKRVLRSKANFSILEGFLSELLYEDIEILEVLESEGNKEDLEDKFNRLDIKVKNSKDEIVIIEIQYDREMDFLQRMLYNSSKTIVEHLKEGEDYSNVVKIISINILYFNFGKGDDYIYKGTTNFIGIHNHSQLELTNVQKKLFSTQNVHNIFPQYYILKVQNFDDNAKDSLDEWIYFLKNSDIKDSFEAKGLKNAQKVLDYLNMDSKERLEYEQWQRSLRDKASAYEWTYVDGMRKGIEKGVKQGIEKGKRSEKEQIARNLLQAQVDIDTIASSTGLSVEEIERVKKETLIPKEE